ncbi:MAG: PspC domain-containing protein [Pseudomonadales bacterium]
MSDGRADSQRHDDAGTRPGAGRSGDFQESVARLERAVDELVSSARGQVSDRASAFIDETTRRLEREIGRHGRRASAASAGAGRRYREDSLEGLPRRLYRDPAREKIGGVCAGIARYYSVEPWVVRCIAVTGLLFFPTIVFPAYWIAYFVMGKPPRAGEEPSRRRRRQAGDAADQGRHDHRSPAPELGPRLSPRYSLRNVQADLTEVELRLRRMETHVTSGQYELQRELNKIDGGADSVR